MKRNDLVRHLEQHGCEFVREGGKHTVYVNRTANRTSTIPRHREINDFLARRSVEIFKFRLHSRNVPIPMRI